ncbi:LysR substrate-binding domain-containing protein [Ostreibacterium oceani]|uniref:LysR family transcriptional regulator n=1 Tax=Ostreibacterium oceani TaxID=2654998 RepID=A0A6N7F0A2_9GAMM|nr:LysR substrate-binding domain-containing protein [Ostreibacterium oceani]MPV85276.1 LysR family transcriptional regulator [Ostreibacterium oceani]
MKSKQTAKLKSNSKTTSKTKAKAKLTAQAFCNLIKVQDLRMIIALDEHGTILNAANVMGLSQPAITKRLQDLERDLGVTLFHRMSRGVEPTPYGEIIIKHAHIIINQLRDAEGEVSDLAAGQGGRLTIGLTVAASTDLVSRSVIELLAQRKNVQINLVEDYNIRLIPSLKRGNLDLIVGRLPNKNQYEDIHIEHFYNETLQLVVRNEHPLAKRKNVSPADLLAWNWLMPPRDSIMYSQIERFFRKSELDLPSASIYSLTHVRSLKVIKSNDLIAAFPGESISDEARDNRITILDVDLSEEATNIGIITRQSGFASPAATLFMDIVRAESKKMGS